MRNCRNATFDMVGCCCQGCGAIAPVSRAENVDAARRAIRSIRIGIKNLAAQPQIGRLAENQKPEFRELLIEFGDSGYITLYRYADDTVTILAVRHQKEIGY